MIHRDMVHVQLTARRYGRGTQNKPSSRVVK